MNKRAVAPLYQINQNSLFGSARQQFKQNDFVQSLWSNRMYNLLRYAKIDNIGGWDFIGKCLGFREWASESNYVLHEIPLKRLCKEDYEWLSFFPKHLQEMYRDYSLYFDDTAFLCEATDCYIARMMYHGVMGQDEVFGVFSNKLNFLTEKRHKGYMYMMEGGWPYIRHFSNDLMYGLFDFSCFNGELIEIDEPCIFLGSRQNYGHWFMDFLSKLYSLDKIGYFNKIPLVVGDIKSFHKESLDLLNIKSDNIIELNSKERRGCILYKLRQAYIPSEVPYDIGRDFLRSKFVNSYLKKKRRRFYLSRKNYGERRRVYNEDEISSFVRNFGFEVVFPEKLSIKETMEICSCAEIIITSLGAQTMNIMFTNNCPLIVLMGDDLMNENDFLWRAAIRDYFLLCDYIIPVISKNIIVKHKDEGKWQTTVEDLCAFDVEAIRQAIWKAEIAITKLERSVL